MNDDQSFWSFWGGISSIMLGAWFVIRYLQGYGLTTSYFNFNVMFKFLGVLNIFKHTKTKSTNGGPYFTGNNKSELLLYGIFYLLLGGVLFVIPK